MGVHYSRVSLKMYGADLSVLPQRREDHCLLPPLRLCPRDNPIDAHEKDLFVLHKDSWEMGNLWALNSVILTGRTYLFLGGVMHSPDEERGTLDCAFISGRKPCRFPQ